MIAFLASTISQSLEGDWEIVGEALPPLGQVLKSGCEDYVDMGMRKC
jgi:hypothetical protein